MNAVNGTAELFDFDYLQFAERIECGAVAEVARQWRSIMTQKEVATKLQEHKAWTFDRNSGRRADLRGAQLQNVDLSGSDLRFADMRACDLTGANLSQADMRNCDLRGANMTNAICVGTNMVNARLDGCNMQGCDLRSAQVDYATMTGVNLMARLTQKAAEMEKAKAQTQTQERENGRGR